MQSRRLQQLGRGFTILLGLTISHGSLGQTRPPRVYEDVRRPAIRRTPVRTPVPPTAAPQPAWVQFGTGNATDVAVGANGVVWIIGNDPAGAADKNIYRWDGSAFQQMVGQAVRIAVDPNGKAWVVNSSGSIFRWIESSWQDMPGKAIDIGIGAGGEVWVLDVNGSPFKWDGNNWRQIGGGGWRIAVDPSGNPWVVNQGNQIWRWKGTSWDLLPGSAKDIAIGPDGSVLIISTTPAPGGFQVQRWADGRWIAEADAAGAGVAAGPAGTLYVMRDTGALVRRSGGTAAPAPSSVPAVAGTEAAHGDEEQLCWKKSFGRGVGTVPTDCPTGQDKDAGLCYSACNSGYKGVGPVCWSNCPSGFRDDGAFCAKPESYGRGGGYPWQFGDSLDDSGMISRCERDHGRGNCEKNGLVYYPKCKANFHAVGCCICSPDCPSDMPDIGVSCTKKSYGRGVGQIPGCSSGRTNDAGLCYESCPRDFDGVGPICWGKCPKDFPFNCGAGCAQSGEACAAAVTEMSLETVSMVASLLSLSPLGGPGVIAAAKTAAKAGAKAAGKVAARGGFKSVSGALKSGAKAYSKAYAKTLVKQYARNKFTDPKNLFSMAFSAAKYAAETGTSEAASLAAANQAVKEMGVLKEENQFDYTLFMSIDPTGISSMVYAFAKYSSCTVEDLASNVEELDFGAGPVTTSDVKAFELTIQNPTTITEITTTPLAGCSISPESDCVGKTLQPGYKCEVRVKVSGQAKIIGEVRVYTTEYDIIPLAIGVKANNGATAECQLEPGAEESVNLSSIAGVWAWNDNQQQKVTINYDGTVKSWRGNGRASIVDPIKRVYSVAIDAGSPVVVTLSPEHDKLTFPGVGASTTSATKRPWDSRCKPGETFFVGLCYDIPVGYETTLPGFMGKPCPSGWRDDGVQCYPLWTGVKVPYQADPDGSLPMQRPILVTDCTQLSQAKGQKCPPNFKGPTVCTCEAQPTSKEVKSIIGKIPGT